MFDEAWTIDLLANSIVQTVAEGERHDGTAGTGARVVRTGTANVMSTSGALTLVIEWIEIDLNGTDTNSAFVINTDSGMTTVRQVIGHGMSNTGSADVLDIDSPARILNSLFYECETTASGSGQIKFIEITGPAANENQILCCTFFALTNDDGTGDATGITIDDDVANKGIRNTIIVDVGGTSSGSKICFTRAGSNNPSDHNLDSDGSLPIDGTNLRNKTAVDQFVSTSPVNLHEKSGADAIDAGTDLGITPAGVQYDIDNRDRDTETDTWDIGADEYVASGATLVVQDSACIVESESVALTQHHALAVQDSACVVESEQPALTQHQVLAVGNAACIVESDTVALTQHQVLAVGDSVCIVESDNVVLGGGVLLAVNDSACVVTSDSPALTQHQVLSVADSACIVESEQPALTQHQTLSVADSKCIVESDNVTFGSGGLAPYYYLLLAG